ncbi:MAG TPA: hypothetical protein PKO18_01260 [Chitinophagales bacterium]|nr:hypothetical protein [Chitinophagales bacterium]
MGKYQALYGGLFKEVFEEQATEQFRHFVLLNSSNKYNSHENILRIDELLHSHKFSL